MPASYAADERRSLEPPDPEDPNPDEEQREHDRRERLYTAMLQAWADRRRQEAPPDA